MKVTFEHSRMLLLSFLLPGLMGVMPVYCMQEVSRSQIDLFDASALELQKINEFLPEPIGVAQYAFEVDDGGNSAEYARIADLAPQELLTRAKLESAIRLIFKKSNSRALSIAKNYVDGRWIITIKCQTRWSMGRLKIKGLLIGKDRYRHYYTQFYGDPFDQKKHEHCLHTIKKKFQESGYFKAELKSELSLQQRSKTIDVTLSLKPRKQYSIGKVLVRLPASSGDADVQKFIENLQKAAYNKELINNEMNVLRQALAAKGIFSASIELEEKINHTAHTVELLFTIEAKQKREFVFFGNTFLSEKQLLEVILLFGKSAWILPAPLLAQELTKEYHRYGFLQVDIQAQEQTEQCLFIIKEGARVSVKEIVLNGVAQFDAPDLIKKHCAPLLTARAYSQQVVQECIDSLIAHYVTYGYWQCQVIQHACEYVPELRGYRLILDIQEGARSVLETVNIAAPFEKLLTHELFQPCLQSLPTPFCVDVLTCQQEVLKRLVPDAVQITPEINHEGACVCVVWRIKMAPEKSYFGKTVVAYPSTLADSYLLRELQYNQNDVYSQEKVNQTIGRIKDLGIFETVQLVPEATPGDPYKKMMVLKAVPDDPYELRLRAGLSLQQMSKEFTFKTVAFVGGGTYMVKNPFNHADQASLDVDYTRGERTIVGKYSRPWIFNYPIKTTFQAYITQYLQPSLTNEHKNLYEFRQHGFLVAFNHKKNIYEGDINLGFEWMETKIATKNQSEAFVDEVARALNFQPLLLDKRVPFFMLEPTLVVDAVDNKLNPTSGSLTLLRLKGMFPMKYLGLNSYFVKIFIDQSVYFPIYKTVLALRGRAGHIFHHNFSNIMPAERFYLGGANSIRSYDTDLCPPLGVVLDKHCNNMLVPQGAQSMLNLNAELRFPIYKFISGAVFQDLGALSNTMFTDIRAKDILAGTGFGVRLNTPIGPLRFDIAWKWRRETKAVSGYSWFLTFGNAF